jgi:hypothetical protein
MKKVTQILGYAALLLVLVMLALFTLIDHTPYQKKDFYMEMDQRLDSLEQAMGPLSASDTLMIGWSAVNITPREAWPMAGYGARDPIEMQGVHDSVYIKTVVFSDGIREVAWVSAELLIIHPELKKAVASRLKAGSIRSQQIFWSASHTHSSVGGWAPGMAGKLFAGPFQQEILDYHH